MTTPKDEAAAELADAIEAKAAADRELTAAVRAARAAGLSWYDIGRAFGVSRQAAWERFAAEAGSSPTGATTMTPLQETLIELVREGNVSQRELARATGLSEKHVSQMLLGRVEGSLTAWDALLDAAEELKQPEAEGMKSYQMTTAEIDLTVRALSELRERGEVSRSDNDAIVNLVDYIETERDS